MHFSDNLIDASLETFHFLEGRNIDGQEELSISAGSGSVHHIAKLCAVGGARQQGGENSHHHTKAYTLVLSDRLDKAHQCGLGIGCWPAIHIKSPAVWNRDAFLVVDANLAMGRCTESKVEHQRALFLRRNGHR